MSENQIMHDPWQKLYPIFSIEGERGIMHSIFLHDKIEAPREFSEILALLDTATSDELVILKINSGGGYLDSASMLIDAIATCEARVVAELSGYVASAATMIALACDDIYTASHITFMIHNFSGGSFGKGHEIEADVSFMIPNTKRFMRETYTGFLDNDEIDRMLDGKDYYFNSEEVLARFSLVKEHRQKLIDAQEEQAQEEHIEKLKELLDQVGYKVTKKATPRKKKT